MYSPILLSSPGSASCCCCCWPAPPLPWTSSGRPPRGCCQEPCSCGGQTPLLAAGHRSPAVAAALKPAPLKPTSTPRPLSGMPSQPPTSSASSAPSRPGMLPTELLCSQLPMLSALPLAAKERRLSPRGLLVPPASAGLALRPGRAGLLVLLAGREPRPLPMGLLGTSGEASNGDQPPAGAAAARGGGTGGRGTPAAEATGSVSLSLPDVSGALMHQGGNGPGNITLSHFANSTPRRGLPCMQASGCRLPPAAAAAVTNAAASSGD